MSVMKSIIESAVADLADVELTLSSVEGGDAIQKAKEKVRHVKDSLSAAPKWIGPTEAKNLLELGSENTIRAWAERNILEHRRLPNNRLQLSLEDVLRKRTAMRGLDWDDQDEMTPEELETLRATRNQGHAPWQLAR